MTTSSSQAKGRNSKTTSSNKSNNGSSTKPKVAKKNENKKSWKKPKDMPKRPLSAYNIFFQHQRKKIVRDRFHDNDGDEVNQEELANALKSGTGRPHRKIHGMIGFVPLARQIASDWKTLDPEEKDVFVKQASVEQERYRKELDIWKKKQEVKKQKEEDAKQQEQNALSAEQQVQEVMSGLIKQQQQQEEAQKAPAVPNTTTTNMDTNANAMMQQLLQQQQQMQQQVSSTVPTTQDQQLQNIFDGCNMEEFGDATFFPVAVEKPAGAGFPSQPQNSLLNHVMAHKHAMLKANIQAQQNATASHNNSSNNNNSAAAAAGLTLSGWPAPAGDTNLALGQLLDTSANNAQNHLGLLDLEAETMAQSLVGGGQSNNLPTDMTTPQQQQQGGNRATPEAIASMQTQLDQLVNQINFMISTILTKNQTPGANGAAQQQQQQGQTMDGLNLTSV